MYMNVLNMRMRVHLVLFFLIIFSCAKENVKELSPEIYGRWQLTEYLLDPGDGSGTWQKANDRQFLSMDRNAQFVCENSLLSSFGLFKIKSDSTLALVKDNSTDSLIVYYKIDQQGLTLQPPCIEGCALLYTKVGEL